jgi:alkanesulfonate monooxygenase SsuD/methylene tetrahydromethanopterin reductase-like flavin-dependent oxidoreductase (luciferase family)
MTIRVGTLADDAMQKGPFEERRALLDRVCDAGLDHVFAADHVSFHTGFGMDGLIQAALIGATHPTLPFYVGIYLLALRHPSVVARQIASYCEAAPGRLIFGVGVGGEDRHEIEVCGVDPSSRGRRTDESLEILRGLLTGEPVDFEGEFFTLENALIKPAPDPAVPIVIGGRSDAALRRTARHGDGWLAAWCSPKRFAQAASQIEKQAAGSGRAGVAWRHGLQVWVGIDDDRDRARERVSNAMTSMYQIPFEPFERYSPYGTPEEIADFLAPYVEAGCSDFNVMAVAEDTVTAIDALGLIKRRLSSL